MATKSTSTKQTETAARTAAKETVRPARKTAPRVSAAKHRTVPSQEVDPVVDNSREFIAAIAYGYWESRGRQGGDPLEDWVRAEREYGNTAAL
jgi:hypothetical protein